MCLLLLLQLEKAQKDPARVQLLYERAVSVFPVTSELWLQYTRYLETELKVPSLINQVGTHVQASRTARKACTATRLRIQCLWCLPVQEQRWLWG